MVPMHYILPVVLLCTLTSLPLCSCHLNSKSSWPDPQTVRIHLHQQQRYSISSSVEKLTESGQITQVSVQDHAAIASTSTSSQDERKGHLLALYPSPSDQTQTIPFTFLNISKASPSYAATGRATVQIKLLNLRSPGFVLRLVSNSTFPSTSTPLVLAESAVITNAIPFAPGQVHLAQHADGQSIVVQWVSGSDAPQQLHYSTVNWRLQHTSSSSSSIPSTPSTSGSPSNPSHPSGSSSSDANNPSLSTRQQQRRRNFVDSRVRWRGSWHSSGSDASSPSTPGNPSNPTKPNNPSHPSSTNRQLGRDFVHSVASSSVTYTAEMMCGQPASGFGFFEPGFVHSAAIPGRDVGHDRKLYYRVGSNTVGWSQLYSFTSAPSAAAVAAGSASFTFLVFNDVGQENAVLFDNVCPPYCPAGWAFEDYTANSAKLMRHLEAESEARLGLLVGDLAYANGYLVDWDYFGFQFEPAFSKWPLMVAAGNHEKPASGSANVRDNSDASGGECGVPYTYRFYTPAWEALQVSATPPQPRVSFEASSRQLGQAFVAAAAATTTAAATASSQLYNNMPSTAAHQGSTTSLSGQASSQQQHPAAAKPVSLQPAPQPHSMQGQLHTDRSFYAFEMGGVHFLMLDTESPSEPGSPQGIFVATDLAKVDRARTPWLVVGLHRQMVGPTSDPVNVLNLARLQSDLEELFFQHKVDLVLQGHDHAYARTCPFAKGKCTANTKTHQQPTKYSTSSSVSQGAVSEHVVDVVHNPQAPIYILAGHAGAGFTHSFPNPLPDWVVFGAENRNGYLRVTVSGGRLRVVSVSTDDGQIMDGVEIVRDQQHS